MSHRSMAYRGNRDSGIGDSDPSAATAAQAGSDASVPSRHSLREPSHRDPPALHDRSRPAGCAGDPASTDTAHPGMRDGDRIDAAGDATFREAVETASAQALRYRRRCAAALIDEAIREHPAARILAFGADHLPETELAATIDGAFAGEIVVVVDRDEQCFAALRQASAGRGLRVVWAPVERLECERPDLRGFDLIHAGDVFDRLAPPRAAALCERLFEMLNPGGRMFITKFPGGDRDAGGAECGLGAWPVRRGDRGMLVLVAGLARDRIAGIELSADDVSSLSCLLVSRQAAGSAAREERLKQSRAACRKEWLRRFIRRP